MGNKTPKSHHSSISEILSVLEPLQQFKLGTSAGDRGSQVIAIPVEESKPHNLEIADADMFLAQIYDCSI